MKEKILAAIDAFISALKALLNLFTEALFQKTETDQVSPLPTPIPLPIPPVPLPTPEVVPDFTFYAMRGEIVGTELVAKENDNVALGEKCYEIRQVETLIPSFLGATPGLYDDPLIEVFSVVAGKKYWWELSRTSAGKEVFTFAGLKMELNVIAKDLPANPSVPFYMELTSRTVTLAHKLAESAVTQGPITKKYVDLYREHRIEPFKQNITAFPGVLNGSLDYDKWTKEGGSFRQLVLDGALAPPCTHYYAGDPSVTLLQAIENDIKSGKLIKPWTYAYDEGELDAGQSAVALARCKLNKQYAPSLDVMITRREDATFKPWVNWFFPVVDWFVKASYTQPYGMYTSNMAQGTTSNHPVGYLGVKPVGTPMMVIESPKIHQRAWPNVAFDLGASRIMYYNGTQKLMTAWDPGGQYFAGGNGDGTLVYTNGTEPAPSLRMKYVRKGMNDIEWKLLARTLGLPYSTTVGIKDWSKDEKDYENIRKTVLAKISG